MPPPRMIAIVPITIGVFNVSLVKETATIMVNSGDVAMIVLARDGPTI